MLSPVSGSLMVKRKETIVPASTLKDGMPFSQPM